MKIQLLSLAVYLNRIEIIFVFRSRGSVFATEMSTRGIFGGARNMDT